MFNSGSTLYLM